MKDSDGSNFHRDFDHAEPTMNFFASTARLCLMAERLCGKCKAVLAQMVEDGIARWVCPGCGPSQRRTRRPRSDYRMKVYRSRTIR